MTDEEDGIFAPLIGWDGAKAVLRSAVRSGDVSVLLEGPPSSGKSVVLEDCLHENVPGTSYHDAAGFTGVQLRETFAQDPDILLLDEIDAMESGAYDAMSVTMEDDVVTKDTYHEQYSKEIDVQVFAACNDAGKLPNHIQRRFRTITFSEYTHSEYLDVCKRLLPDVTHWVESEETAQRAAQAVYEETGSKDPREARDVAKLASGIGEVRELAAALTDPKTEVSSEPIHPDEAEETASDEDGDDDPSFADWIQLACPHAEPSRESDLFQSGDYLCEDCAKKLGASADTPLPDAAR